MINMIKVFKLSFKYLNYCSSMQKLIFIFGVIEFALITLYSNIINPIVFSMLFDAIETTNINLVYINCGICAVIVCFFYIIAYLNDVYIDLNSFKIKESILIRNCIDLYELPYDKVNATYDNSQIQARLDEGSGSADGLLIFIFIILANITSVIALLIMSSSISWLLFVITSVSILFSMVLTKIEVKSVKRYEPIRQDATGKSNAQMGYAAHGILTSNMNNMEDEIYQKYKILRKNEWDVTWKRERISLIVNASSIIITGMIRCILGMGMYFYYDNQRITSANVASSFSVYDQMGTISKNFSSPFSAINTSLIMLDRMDELKNIEEKNYLAENINNNQTLIHLNNIYYTFGEKTILNNINITIQQGEKVAIIGHNGSGKSTLLHLLCGLYHPQQGLAMLEGACIGNMDIHTKRKQMTYIPANTLLYNESVKTNILMNANDDELCKYSKAITDAKIIEDSIKEDTLTTELSGGQAQRVNIARGLVHQSNILIADEPTAGIPVSQGEAILQQLLNTYETCIVVTHQKDSIKFFTRVVVMEAGNVVSDVPVDVFLKSNEYNIW